MNMSKISDEHLKIIDIFNQVQNTSSCHQKCLLNLTKIYKEDPARFFIHFTDILTTLLVQDYKTKNDYVSRTLDFLSSFLTNDDNTDLLVKTVEFFLSVHDIVDENARFRSCQFINVLFNHMVGGEITEELCDAVQEAMLERLKDGKAEIRLQAVTALYRLQNPSDLNDPIINSYILHMSSDSNSKVRKECIERVAPRKDVIPYIIERTKDVDVQVRISAFSKLAKLVKFMKIGDRQNVIKYGFRDPSDSVKDFVSKKMITGWLSIYKDNILELLKAVRLDADENDINESMVTINYILSSLFRTQTQKELLSILPLGENRVIDFENLNWETSTYWRFFAGKLRENTEYENLLNEILPELVEFVVYIKKFCMWVSQKSETLNMLEVNYILREMFEITLGYDISDVASCKALNELIQILLLEIKWISEDTIKQIIKNLDQSIPDAAKQIQFVCDVISQLLSPPPTEEEIAKNKNKQFKIAELKLKQHILIEEQKECIRKEDFIKAAAIKTDIQNVQQLMNHLEAADLEDENNETKTYDAKSLVKCLDIIMALLLSPKIVKFSKELRSLKDDVIQDLLIHPIELIKIKALKCYSLCSILDSGTAETGIHIFSARVLSYHAGDECDIETLITSINTVGDLIVLFGSKLVVAPEDQGLTDSMNEQQLEIFAGGSSLTNIIQALVDLMDDEIPKVQEAAGYALCNLIMSRRIHSSTLFSRMILKWCSPVSDAVETVRLKQLIGCVLEKFPSLPEADTVIEKAFIQTIKVLLEAPDDSPLSDVDINKVMKCMLELSYSSQNDNAHNSLAIALCQELIDKSKSPASLYFSKALLFLRLSPEDKNLIDHLLKLCDTIRDKIVNKQILNNIIKFTTRLLSLSDQNNSLVKTDKEILKEKKSIEN